MEQTILTCYSGLKKGENKVAEVITLVIGF